jgi:enoyl-[acyl-carrier protein] reductase III
MSNELSGKKALITGASRGIGRATAIRLAKSGAEVAINFVSNETAARDVASEIMNAGGKAILIKADISEESDIQQMFSVLQERWGNLDILVSNAASGGFRPLMAATARNFDAAMHTNVRAFMLLVQSAMPMLLKSTGNRKVVALSSHGSHRALNDYALIGASKAAIESLCRHMALEFGPKGINFNCLLAGLVLTDSTRGITDVELAHHESNARMLIGEGRLLQPTDVADVIHFLVSSSSDLIQGQVITVDGGMSLRL